MPDPVQSTRMGVVRLTNRMPVVSMMVNMWVVSMLFGTMLGTEVST